VLGKKIQQLKSKISVIPSGVKSACKCRESCIAIRENVTVKVEYNLSFHMEKIGLLNEVYGCGKKLNVRRVKIGRKRLPKV
jgi:hypothetical protein